VSFRQNLSRRKNGLSVTGVLLDEHVLEQAELAQAAEFIRQETSDFCQGLTYRERPFSSLGLLVHLSRRCCLLLFDRSGRAAFGIKPV
jgi:hypothetical protein